MTAEDTTRPGPQSVIGAVPRPRPAAVDPAPPAPDADPPRADTARATTVVAPVRATVPAGPELGRHAAGRAPGMARRAGGALARGATGVAIGGVQSVWRVAAWRRTPVGGFVVPLLLLVVVLGAAGAVGATLPQRHPGQPHVLSAPPPPPTPSPAPSDTPVAGDDVPSEQPSSSAPGRPVDGLTSWAQQLSPVVGVPVPALKAYGSAQLVAALITPACQLSWTTLAGIGKVESGHGTANGSTLQASGTVRPPIIGPALDGSGGRALVRDTDLGQLDGDATYDHAIGPMQFLPATWATYQADGDDDGIRDPSNLNDAALAAAGYLCANGRNLTKPADWWAAILAYNGVPAYAQSVYAAADQYGKLSRTVTTG